MVSLSFFVIFFSCLQYVSLQGAKFGLSSDLQYSSLGIQNFTPKIPPLGQNACAQPRGSPTHPTASILFNIIQVSNFLCMPYRIHIKRLPPQSLKVARLHVSRHRRQSHHQAIQLLGHYNLAAQTAGLGQAKSEVQHIVLVVFGFGHLVKMVFSLYDDMASRACA